MDLASSPSPSRNCHLLQNSHNPMGNTFYLVGSDPRDVHYPTHGIEYISDTLEHTASCSKFVALTDCVIASIVTPAASGNVTADTPTEGNATIYNVPVAAGEEFPVPFSSITLTGGKGYGVKI